MLRPVDDTPVRQVFLPGGHNITRRSPIRSKNYHDFKGQNVFSHSTSIGQVFCFGRGHEYGSWITDNERSIDSIASGDLVVRPPHIIEFIARYAGLTTSNIDIAAFDKAYTDLGSTWEFKGILNREKDWMEIAEIIAAHSKSRIWFNNENKLTISVYDSTKGFTIADGDTPHNRDIFNEDATITNNRYDQHPIIRGTLTYTKTLLRDTINEMYLHYHKNLGSGGFQKVTFITDADSDDGAGTQDQNGSTYPDDRETVASNSKTNYRMTGRLNVEAPFIYLDATAQALREHLFDLKVDRRLTVVFRTYFNVISVEKCDIINIRHSLLTKVITKKLAYTDGGAGEILIGDTLTGDTSTATCKVKDITLASGSWAGGNAAGTIYLYSQTGTFESETLNETAPDSVTNVCTISADSVGINSKKWEVVRHDIDLQNREIEIEAVELLTRW